MATTFVFLRILVMMASLAGSVEDSRFGSVAIADFRTAEHPGRSDLIIECVGSNMSIQFLNVNMTFSTCIEKYTGMCTC